MILNQWNQTNIYKCITIMIVYKFLKRALNEQVILDLSQLFLVLINYLYLGALKSFLCAIQRQHTRKTNLISAIDDQTFYTYFSSIPEFFPFHSESSFICVTHCLRLESNKSPNKITREQGKSVSRPILASFVKQTTYKQ